MPRLADQNLIWSNLTRQTVRRGLPRIGQAVTIDVYGPAGTPWILFVSCGTGATPSPFGTILLDPTDIHRLTGGALDMRGRASPGFAIPADPLLVGQTFYLQSVVGLPLRLTNLETFEITDL